MWAQYLSHLSAAGRPKSNRVGSQNKCVFFTKLESLTGTSQINNFMSVKRVPYVFVKGNPVGSKWLTLVAQ